MDGRTSDRFETGIGRSIIKALLNSRIGIRMLLSLRDVDILFRWTVLDSLPKRSLVCSRSLTGPTDDVSTISKDGTDDLFFYHIPVPKKEVSLGLCRLVSRNVLRAYCNCTEDL